MTWKTKGRERFLTRLIPDLHLHHVVYKDKKTKSVEEKALL